jgi:cytidine deaminase
MSQRSRKPLSNETVLSADDHELISVAVQTLERHYRAFWHTVAAAIRSRDGRIWTGIHIGAIVGRLSVCAEAVALGRTILDGDASIASIVAVRHPKPEEVDREMAVVSPCGACREMIFDYAPSAMIILRVEGTLTKLPVRELLPIPYRR